MKARKDTKDGNECEQNINKSFTKSERQQNENKNHKVE